MSKRFSVDTLPSLAYNDFATTAPPITTAGGMGFSSTNGVPMFWNGTVWRMAQFVPIAASLASEIVASNTAADTNIISVTIPANVATAGMQLEVEIYGQTDNTTTAGTASAWLKLNSSTKLGTASSLTSTTAKTAQPFYARFLLTFRTVGSSGTLIVATNAYFSGAATPAPVVLSPTATTTVNTTSAVSIALGVSWAAAVSGNIIRVDTASIYQTMSAVIT